MALEFILDVAIHTAALSKVALKLISHHYITATFQFCCIRYQKSAKIGQIELENSLKMAIKFEFEFRIPPKRKVAT